METRKVHNTTDQRLNVAGVNIEPHSSAAVRVNLLESWAETPGGRRWIDAGVVKTAEPEDEAEDEPQLKGRDLLVAIAAEIELQHAHNISAPKLEKQILSSLKDLTSSDEGSLEELLSKYREAQE